MAQTGDIATAGEGFGHRLARPDSMHARAWLRSATRWALLLPALLIVGLFLFTGIRGVDFGFHWDEFDWQIKPARDMVASGTFLPRSYNYPSFAKWLVLLPSFPAAIESVAKGADVRAIQKAWLAAIDTPGYLLRVREVFLFVSALAIVWVHATVLALRRTRLEALAAAAALGLSWEYAYHSRWVATDCILVQFSALTLLVLALFHRTGRVAWLHAAAIAAGLGTGTKFPGVVLLVPVLISSALTMRPRPFRAQAARLASMCAMALVAYLVTTPATVLDPFLFVEHLRGISDHYKTGHWGYTVAGTLDHWRLALMYLSVTFFSPNRALAVVLFAAAVLGALVWVRAEWRIGILLVAFPLAFLAFFCGTYRVMIARNYLLLTPFLSVLAARGLARIVETASARWVRAALIATMGGAWIAQAMWLVAAAESIRHIDATAQVRDAIAYVARNPATRFRLSRLIQNRARRDHLTLPSNVVDRAATADDVVFFARAEGPGFPIWKTNDPWLTEAVFGPREVNFNWYSCWAGADHVVVMTRAKARAGAVALAW